jgi:hypothetical protein
MLASEFSGRHNFFRCYVLQTPRIRTTLPGRGTDALLGRGRDGALLSSKFTGEGEERRVCGERLGRRCLLFHEPTWNRAAFSAMFF